MMVPDPQSILAKLGATIPERLVALRYLKNELVGHSQKKEDWVRYGVLRPIVKIITLKPYQANDEDPRLSFLTLNTFTDEDTTRLQALQLLASFANAGPAFLPPLHAAGALPAVLSSLCLQNQHTSIALAALRVVRDIAAAAEYAPPSSPITLTSLADKLFTDDSYLESLRHILSRKIPSVDNEAQTQMIAYLIKSLCREERHQSELVSSGILDALATKLASFIAFNGQVLPRAEILARIEGLEDHIPTPAMSRSSLNGVLGAIASIIGESPYRACKLIYSPPILATLPLTDIDVSKTSMSALGLMELPGIRPTKHMNFQPMDLLLPYDPPPVNNHTVIPPPSVLREGQGHNGRSTSKYQNSTTSRTQSEDNSASLNETDSEEAESPLIPFLICAIRSWRSRGSDVLGATSILTSLFKAGLAYKTRESDLGLLILPIILNILKEAEMLSKFYDFNDWGSNLSSRLLPIEEMPAILARLITDSELLQKAAFECNAVKLLCKLLKESCGPPPSLPKSWSWSPHNRSQDSTDELPPECRLGEEGQHKHLVHRIKVRENTLKALGALATYKDDYRKVVVEQEVIPYIVESLTPAPENPISVVLAACYTVRMLSRSVNILRTTLVDHGVSAPLCQLLRHHDIEVQVAASASVCNLLMDFSPMREPLVEAGILKELCEHAHSHNASLRLNSLWALKHLVHSASVDLKKSTVEELESGWLVRLICDDTEDDALFSAKARSEREAAQDTLDDMDEDIDMGLAEDQYRTWLSASFYKTPTTRPPPDARILRLAEARLENLREAEINPIRKARHDDLAIQEQGLGLIRNLIGGAHSSSNADSPNDTTEMIDFLFNTLGQDRLFEILASKLRVKVLHPFSQRNGTGAETRILPPQTKIIESVIYILVHIAASIPRHRQLVVSQTELLKQLAKLFNNQDREVRVALCHLINNLTWQDNASDGPGCSQRASELKKLGFLSKLEALKEGDDELDVRERAKAAFWQMKPAY